MENIITELFTESDRLVAVMIAVGLGIFVGLRRTGSRGRAQSTPADIMGVRTTTLLVLAGTIVTFFDHLPFVFPAVFTAILLFLLIAYINGVFRLSRYGLTSEITGVLLFLIGILIGEGQVTLAIVLTVIIGISTAYKSHIHNFADTFSLAEWSGTLQLLVITALVLPFLPRTAIDPFGVFVPFNMWLLVILVSAIGFVGYFCGKYLSARASLIVTAICGSLVSSTATTVMLAGRAKRAPIDLTPLLLTGLMISIAVMHLRVVLEIIVLRPQQLSILLIVPVSMLCSAVIVALIVMRSRAHTQDQGDYTLPEGTRPFEFLPALKFAAFFTVILYTIYFADALFGVMGVYISAFLTSFVDVDAVVFSSLLTADAGHITARTALVSIAIALVMNTLVKLLYIRVFGSWAFLRQALPGVSIVVIVGIVASIIAAFMIS